MLIAELKPETRLNELVVRKIYVVLDFQLLESHIIVVFVNKHDRWCAFYHKFIALGVDIEISF